MASQSEALDLGFNVAVLHIASRLFPMGFDVSPTAPMGFVALNQQIETGRMVVWSGGSDHTIFGDPEVNYAARAWHDWTHLRGHHPFTLVGEAAVAEMQCQHPMVLYGDDARTRGWCRLIDAEVNGQQLYELLHGHFPRDQIGFTKDYLRHGAMAATRNHD